jgi:phosphoribosylanthranilate isomerase
MDQAPYVKICGVKRPEDAAVAVDAGADAIGLNFVEKSPRFVDMETAKRIVAAVKADIDIVAVVADKTLAEMDALRDALGITWLQLHGDEPPAAVRHLMPDVWKAVRIAAADDVRRARLYPGSSILVDAKVNGLQGGSGETFDWSLVRHLASERRLVLAGGLTPSNVRDAILEVGPWGVDVASGVESAPGVKDADKVRAFVTAAREAAAERRAQVEGAGAAG